MGCTTPASMRRCALLAAAAAMAIAAASPQGDSCGEATTCAPSPARGPAKGLVLLQSSSKEEMLQRVHARTSARAASSLAQSPEDYTRKLLQDLRRAERLAASPGLVEGGSGSAAAERSASAWWLFGGDPAAHSSNADSSNASSGEAAAAVSSGANASTAAEAANASSAVNSSGVCATRYDPRVSAWGYTTAEPGTPCIFGLDDRDEGTHCIYDGGQYGSYGWCLTSFSRDTWGSCNEHCPLYGQMKSLAREIDGLRTDIRHLKQAQQAERAAMAAAAAAAATATNATARLVGPVAVPAAAGPTSAEAGASNATAGVNSTGAAAASPTAAAAPAAGVGSVEDPDATAVAAVAGPGAAGEAAVAKEVSTSPAAQAGGGPGWAGGGKGGPGAAVS